MVKKILIIDDEQAIRETLEQILSYEGYAVLKAATGAEGLDIAAGGKNVVFHCGRGGIGIAFEECFHQAPMLFEGWSFTEPADGPEAAFPAPLPANLLWSGGGFCRATTKRPTTRTSWSATTSGPRKRSLP